MKKMVIRAGPGEDFSGPNDETKVQCPACGKGMVTPVRAKKVADALKDEPEEIPMIVTGDMPKLPEE